MSKDAGAEPSTPSESIDICHRKVPKSVLVQVFQCLDKGTLKVASQVSRSFNQLSKHPSLCVSAMYSGYAHKASPSFTLISLISGLTISSQNYRQWSPSPHQLYFRPPYPMWPLSTLHLSTALSSQRVPRLSYLFYPRYIYLSRLFTTKQPFMII